MEFATIKRGKAPDSLVLSQGCRVAELAYAIDRHTGLER